MDSNLLLLLFIGMYQPSLIETYKRLSRYTRSDFDLLSTALSNFRLIVTTPNILTEVSNLSSAIPDSHTGSYFESFATTVALLKEEYVPSSRVIQNQFATFGLTDAAIAEIAEKQYLVLTDDFRLSQSLQAAGIDTLNFNHLRDADWTSS